MPQITHYKAITNIALVIFVLFFGYSACESPAPQKEVPKEEIVKTPYKFEDEQLRRVDSIRSTGNFEEALSEYAKLRDEFKDKENWPAYIYAYERVAYCQRRTGLDSIWRGTYANIIVEGNRLLGRSHLLLSKIYSELGKGIHFTREYLTAAAMIDTALQIYERSDEYDSALMRSIVDYKFYTYYSARKSNDTVLKYLDIQKAFIEKSRGSKVAQEFLLDTYYVRIYRQMGDFERALAYGQEAVRLGLQNPSSISEEELIDALFVLGAVFFSQDDYQNSLRVSLQALERVKKVYHRNNQDMAQYYNLVAISLQGLEKYTEAIEYFKESLRVLDANNFRYNAYWTFLMNIGLCYERIQEYDQAKSYLVQALRGQQSRSGNLGAENTDKFSSLARFYSNQGDHERALIFYDSALRAVSIEYEGGLLDIPDSSSVESTITTLDILDAKLSELTNIFLTENNLEIGEAARTYANLSEFVLFENRKEYNANQGKLHLTEQYRSIYNSAIEVLYGLYNGMSESEVRDDIFSEAFRFISQSKANLYVDQAGEFYQIKNSNIPVETRSNYFQLINQLEILDSDFYRLIKQSGTSDSIRIINSKRVEVTNQLAEIQNSVKSSVKGLDSNFGWVNDPMELLEPIQSGLSRDELFIEYFIGDDFVYYLSISNSNTEFFRTEFDDSFKSSLKKLIFHLNNSPSFNNIKVLVKDYQEAAYDLYVRLLKPVLDNHPHTKVLRIIPDEQLSRIPFEALVKTPHNESEWGFHQLDYLLNDYTITYQLSSRSGWNKFDKKRSKVKSGLLGFGYTGGGIVDSRSGLGSLPGTTREIEFLKKTVPGKYFLGELGTKQTFLKEVSNYDVIHVAVHGIGDSTNRFNSRLVFNGADDNVLKTNDLYVTDIPARLAVLSACESGVGEINIGEGTFSIARGFSLAGVPSIVMSLWTVNDEASSRLMVEFHKNLLDNHRLGTALNLTKRQYLDRSDEYTSHPYYWSAFVALGEDNKIYGSNTLFQPLYMAIVTGLFVLTFRVLYNKKKRRT